MITIYGIKNCDTMKKAMRWLEQKQVPFHFHDYRKDGLDKAQLQQWLNQLGWETLINKRGTTWRNLDEALKQSMDNQLALETLMSSPAMIKRPLLLCEDGKIVLGFSEKQYTELAPTE